MTQASADDRPEITVNWTPRTVRNRARGGAARLPDWTFFETKILDTTYRVGLLPRSILDINPITIWGDPTAQPDSIWQLWCDFGGGEMEPALRIGTCSQETALAEATRRVRMQVEEDIRVRAKRLEEAQALRQNMQMSMAI